jgi:hypothetical protein
LNRLGIGASPTQPLQVAGNVFVDAATANLYMKDTSTGLQSSTSGILTLQTGNSFRGPGFTSGVNGWDISAPGRVEFLDGVFRGELRSSVFRVNEIIATAGTSIVAKSAAILAADCTTAAVVGSSFNFIAKNSDGGVSLFAAGDFVQFKTETPSGIFNSWARVDFLNNTGAQTEYNSALMHGSTSATFKSGTGIVDFGPAGSAFISLSADGTIGATPNMTMATHSGTPWISQTIRTRMGNLNGWGPYSTNVYGFVAGEYGVVGQSWITADSTNGFRVGNNATVLGQWDGSGNLRLGELANNKANAYWNASNSRFEFRGSTGGTVVQSYIDTDGAFVAGAGNVKLNATGLLLSAPLVETGTSSIRWFSGADITGGLYGINAASLNRQVLYSVDTRSAGSAQVRLSSSGDGFSATFDLGMKGTTNASNPNTGFATLGGGNFAGLTIQAIGTVPYPTAMLDVYGDIKSRITVNDQGYILQGATTGISPVFKFATSAGSVMSRIGIAGGTNGLVTGAAASDLVIRSESNAILFTNNGGVSASMKITSAAVQVVLGGTLKTIEQGAADSGGAGKRMLVVAN